MYMTNEPVIWNGEHDLKSETPPFLVIHHQTGDATDSNDEMYWLTA